MKVGGFIAMDLVAASQDVSGLLDPFDQATLKDHAKRLDAELQRELFMAKTGAVRADEEMFAASSAKRRATLVADVQAGRRQLVKAKVRPLPPPGPAAPIMQR